MPPIYRNDMNEQVKIHIQISVGTQVFNIPINHFSCIPDEFTSSIDLEIPSTRVKIPIFSSVFPTTLPHEPTTLSHEPLINRLVELDF